MKYNTEISYFVHLLHQLVFVVNIEGLLVNVLSDALFAALIKQLKNSNNMKLLLL